jgi:SAM-dependent methyltransferase
MRFDYHEVNKSKVLNILRFHGLGYLIKRVCYRFFLQPVILCKKEKSFKARGTEYPYFHHSYNTTFINERAVEIPYFRYQIDSRLKERKRVLEIGNVLSHYGKASWDIVDKFENGEGVINVDIMEFRPSKPYDLIVAISTFEHIGFDEQPRDDEKVFRALDYIKKTLLKQGGELIFSIPAGYNPHIEEHLKMGRITSNERILLKRIDWKNNWTETVRDEDVFGLPYALFARGLIICHQRKD